MTTDIIIYTDDDTVLDTVKNTAHITIKSSCTTIRGNGKTDYAFFNSKDTIETVSFEPNPRLLSISPYSFYECSKLSFIDLSVCNQLTTIAEYAFYNCDALQQISLPHSLQTIGSYGFSSSGLKSITIPGNVTTFHIRCFTDCSSLTSIEFDDDSKLSTIDSHAFMSTGIKCFHIPQFLRTISGTIFTSCYDLTSITIDNRNTYLTVLNNVVFNQNKTVLLAYPPGLTHEILDNCKEMAIS